MFVESLEAVREGREAVAQSVPVVRARVATLERRAAGVERALDLLVRDRSGADLRDLLPALDGHPGADRPGAGSSDADRGSERRRGVPGVDVDPTSPSRRSSTSRRSV